MNRWSSLVLLALAVLVSSVAGQTSERYVVSARAGGVNFVSGQVSVTRAGGGVASLLRQDSIEVGDEASTADGAYAEVLLDPGSYMRLAPNSRFRFASTSLEDTRVELLAGSAIFEINADNSFALSVNTPTATLRLDHSGIYRVNLDPPPGDLEVVKGTGLVGSTEVKAGKLLKLEAGAVPEKFDPKNMDAFASWSDSRAKDLATVARAVESNALDRSLANSYASNGWEFLPSYPGLWVWDSFYSSGFFLPFQNHRHNWSYGYCRDPYDWNRYAWTERRFHHDHDRSSAGGNTTAVTTKPLNGGHPNTKPHSNDSQHSRESRHSGDSTSTGVVKQAKPPTGGSTGSSNSSGGRRSTGGSSSGSHNSGGSNSGSHSSSSGGSQHNSSGSGGSHSSGGSSSSGSHSSSSGSSSSSGKSSSSGSTKSTSEKKDH